jgi:hypothetical protein
MHRDLLKIIKNSVGFLIILVICLFVYFQICSHYSQIPLRVGVQWMDAFMIAKEEIANDKKSPKIVILAGSNADFSFSAQMIEEELGIPTVNFGSTAEFSEYIFYRAKKILNTGDTVLMPLEYYYYYCEAKKPFGNATLRERYILPFDQDYYQSRSFFEKISMQFVGLRDLIAMMDRENWDYEKNDHIESTSNESGDELNTGFENKPEKLIEVDEPIDLSEVFETDYCVGNVENFLDWAKNNNVRVIAAFPTIYDFDGAYESDSYSEKFELIKKFYKERQVELIGDPYQSMYPYEDFFNTGYHLHGEARDRHTEKVIDELRVLGL